MEIYIALLGLVHSGPIRDLFLHARISQGGQVAFS